MSSKRVWGILAGLAGALLLHQAYHWLEKEWSTAILSEVDDGVAVETDDGSQEARFPDDQGLGGETHQNQFGAPGPTVT